MFGVEMLKFADEKKDYDFACLYYSMMAFDNSPRQCQSLKENCERMKLDYDRMRCDLLAFDCHSGGAKTRNYIEKVNAKARTLARQLGVEVLTDAPRE